MAWEPRGQIGIPEAPRDGRLYGRRDGEWVEINAAPLPVAPSNQVAPALTGSPVLGATLSVSDGTWAGDEPITLARQWHIDGVDVPGATGATFTTTNDYAMAVAGCRVTATNAAGSASAESNTLQLDDVVEPPSGDTPTLEDTTANAVISNGGRSLNRIASDAQGEYAAAMTAVAIAGRQYLEVHLRNNGDGCTASMYGGSSPLTVDTPPGLWWGEPGATIGLGSQWSMGLYANYGSAEEVNSNFRNLDGTVPAVQVVRWAIDASTRQVWVSTVDDPTWFGGGDPAAGTNPSFVLNGTDPIRVGATSHGANGTATLRLASENELAPPAGFTAFMVEE